MFQLIQRKSTNIRKSPVAIMTTLWYYGSDDSKDEAMSDNTCMQCDADAGSGSGQVATLITFV